MAIFTASRSFLVSDIYTFFGNVTTATSSKISLYDPAGTIRVDYSGAFKYSNGYLSSGTLKTATVYDTGLKYYTITGNYDAVEYNSYAGGDTETFLNYIFSGNDTFNGSSGNDWMFFGNYGNDTYNGNAGNDILLTNIRYSSKANGGIGDDFIASYGYGDVLSGGKGKDYFYQYDLLGASVIKDYSIKEGDWFIVGMQGLSQNGVPVANPFYYNADFDVYEPLVSQIAVGKGIKNSLDSDDYFIYDTSTGKLYYDVDAGGRTYSAGLIATFSNKPKFTATELANYVINIEDANIVGVTVFSNYLDANAGTYGL